MHQDRISEDWFPVSAAQRGRWFLYQLNPAGQGSHNNVFAARLHGAVDVDAIARAMRSLVDRHPQFRAHFRQHHGEPQQRIAAAVELSVPCCDASGMSREALRQRIMADAAQPFDTTRPPLVRAGVYRRGPDEAVLLLVFDHLVIDGWSYWQVLEELGALLAAGGAGLPPPASGAATYLDYVEWQRAWVDSPEGESQLRYWAQDLAGELPKLQLPADRSISQAMQEARKRHEEVVFDLPAGLTRQLRELTRKQSSTLFVTLLAAYQMLLCRYAGQDEVVVGTVMPGRGNGEWDDVVGDFVNPIPIRSRFDAGATVAQALKAVRGTVLRGMSHQDYPFDLLVEKLHPSRELGDNPLFQTMFIFQKARRGADLASLWAARDEDARVKWGGFDVGVFPVHKSDGNGVLALSLEVLEFEEHVGGVFKYDPALFDRTTVERLARCFATLLEGMAADDQALVSRLPLLDDAQRQQLLVDWNRSDAPYPLALTYADVFERQAAAHPDRIAAVCDGARLTYAELDRRANRLARALRDAGAGRDTLVALAGERDLPMLAMMLAV
ncbi:MAG TPA: condensation domain-containing protein, partial [Paucimonas sp.]|nr:condensation domain-containing protein [Paucimonas sp.]